MYKKNSWFLIPLTIAICGILCGRGFSIYKRAHNQSKRKKNQQVKQISQKPIVIIIPFSNNIDRSLESIFSQSYDAYRIVVVGDISTKIMQEKIELVSYDRQKPISYIQTKKPVSSVEDLTQLKSIFSPEEIVLPLQKNIWLAHDHVFTHINSFFQSCNIRLIYGNYLLYPSYRGENKKRDIPIFVSSYMDTPSMQCEVYKYDEVCFFLKGEVDE